MKELNKKEMMNTYGGGVGWLVIAGVGAIITFIIGIVDGYTNPSKCRS